MFRANAGNTTRKNLTALRREFTEFIYVFVVDLFDVIDAIIADFSSRSSASISSHCETSISNRQVP